MGASPPPARGAPASAPLTADARARPADPRDDPHAQAAIWDNRRLSHSRTPLALYSNEEERRMWQLIRHHAKRGGMSAELR